MWQQYIEARKPHWGDLHYRDHIDKAGGLEGTREIPATPYMLHLLAGLPKRNEFFFFKPNECQRLPD